MTPQDGRSPIQQLRSIELFNEGGEEIPAHGIVEVVSTVVVDAEFRTVAHVRRPSKDGIPNVLINGPVPIATGRGGWGSLDGPLFAMGSGASIGEMVGSKKDDFNFKRGVPGFVIHGTGTAPGTTTQKVQYLWCPIIDANADLLCPEDATATITDAEFGVATLPTITSALNIYGLASNGGDPVTLKWKCSLEKWIVLQTRKVLLKVINRVYAEDCVIKQDFTWIAADYCVQGSETAIEFVSVAVADDLTLTNGCGGSGSGSGSGQDCSLSLSKTTICVLSATASSSSVVVTFTAVEVLVSAEYSEELGCLYGLTKFAYVPCVCDGSLVEIFCADPCASGSGSGSGS